MELSFPALAQRVTVLGSTRNSDATSAGVSNFSTSVVRVTMTFSSCRGTSFNNRTSRTSWEHSLRVIRDGPLGLVTRPACGRNTLCGGARPAPSPTRQRPPRAPGVTTVTTSSSPTAPSAVASMSQNEQVVFCHDRETGLRAIIGIYSTALGPALGGTRFYPYASEAAAPSDVLRPSDGRARKNAVPRRRLGGGNAVILDEPATDRTPEL